MVRAALVRVSDRWGGIDVPVVVVVVVVIATILAAAATTMLQRLLQRHAPLRWQVDDV